MALERILEMSLEGFGQETQIYDQDEIFNPNRHVGILFPWNPLVKFQVGEISAEQCMSEINLMIERHGFVPPPEVIRNFGDNDFQPQIIYLEL